jgi:DNA-directed RNA polymerase specialized sigma24 family protein
MTQQSIILPDHSADLKRIQEQLDGLQSMLQKVIITPKPEWVTVKEYAKHMSKTIRTINSWIEDGKVETKMVGGVKMVRVET